MKSGRLFVVAASVALTILGVMPAAHAVGPNLTVSLFVDKVVARQGEQLNYRITVRNSGDAPTTDTQIQSHIPAGTTEAPVDCPIPADTCIGTSVAVPGLGDEAHQINADVGPLTPGQELSLSFSVFVNADTAVGTHVVNHAHASDVLITSVTSGPTDTLVVGAVPNGAFGGNSMTVSGGSVTDSYDSSQGSYTATHTNAGGDIGSNSNINVAGGTVINGNATPGPGKTVTISNNSTVTGSTAPATSTIVLNDVDASPYASNNDNATICAAPGSCSGASYNAVTKTFTVAGSATLLSGSYYLCQLNVSGSLTVAGPATLWVGAPEACGGAAGIAFSSGGSNTISSGRARDFQVRVQGSNTIATTIKLTSHATITGAIYAPRTTFDLSGGSALFGSATSGSVTGGSGGCFIHFDRSLR